MARFLRFAFTSGNGESEGELLGRIFRGNFHFRKFKFDFQEFMLLRLVLDLFFFNLNENYESLVSSLKRDALF